MEQFSKGGVADRAWFAASISNPRQIDNLFPVGMGNFVVLLAWDAENTDNDEIADVARKLLKNGARYFCCWARDCERVHDEIDKTAWSDMPDSCIMTTWHEKDSLEDALDFSYDSSAPDDEFANGTSSGIALSIGSKLYSAQIGLYLTKRTLENAT